MNELGRRLGDGVPVRPVGAQPAAVEPAADDPAAPGPAGPSETIASLAGGVLPALIARLDASGLGELEVRTDAWRIRLRKPYDRRRAVSLPEGRRRHGEASEAGHPRRVDTARGDAARPDAHAPWAEGGHAGRPAEVRPAGVRGAGEDDGRDGRGDPAITVDPLAPAIATSPAVGYFAPRDGWTTGRHVRSGDVVGHVDCLGVRVDVVAPVDGFFGRLLAQAGEAVEYGQPLVHVDLPRPATAAPAPAAESPAEPPATGQEGD